MRLQVGIALFALLLSGAGAAEKTAEQFFGQGDYREALKAFQARNLIELSKLRKVPANMVLADSPSWTVESKKELAALCLFENGFRAWMDGDSKGEIALWLDSQKQTLSETSPSQRYCRRTQLAILQASWGQFLNDADRMDALSKSVVGVQEFPLPDRPWDFRFQLEAEQQIVAIVEYMSLFSKANSPSLLKELFDEQAERRRDLQLVHGMTKASSENEVTYETIVDRLLFSSFRATLWKFSEAFLQSPAGGGALALANPDNFRLIRVFLELESPEPDSFRKALKSWVDGHPSSQPKVLTLVLLDLIQSTMDSSDVEYSKRVFEGVSPYFDRITWPNDAYQGRVAHALQEIGDFKGAAKLMESAVMSAKDDGTRAERLAALLDIRSSGGDYVGAYESGRQAIALAGEKALPHWRRQMATVCISLRRYGEAAEYLQKYFTTLGEGDERIEVKYLMGWAWALDKKFDQARTYLQAVVDSYPDSIYAKKAMDYLRVLPKEKK